MHSNGPGWHEAKLLNQQQTWEMRIFTTPPHHGKCDEPDVTSAGNWTHSLHNTPHRQPLNIDPILVILGGQPKHIHPPCTVGSEHGGNVQD